MIGQHAQRAVELTEIEAQLNLFLFGPMCRAAQIGAIRVKVDISAVLVAFKQIDAGDCYAGAAQRS